MGLSSNARLLTITAKLTQNEFETQRIASAKLQLSAQTQKANMDYLAAMNIQKFEMENFGTDVNSDSLSTSDLTLTSMYQYSDMKNQYLLNNSAGQALVSNDIAEIFKKSNNLQEFLVNNGVSVGVIENGQRVEYKDSKLFTTYKKLQENIDDKISYQNLLDDYIKGREKIPAMKDMYDASIKDSEGWTGNAKIPVIGDYLSPWLWIRMGYGEGVSDGNGGYTHPYGVGKDDDTATTFGYRCAYPDYPEMTVNQALRTYENMFNMVVDWRHVDEEIEWETILKNGDSIYDNNSEANSCITEENYSTSGLTEQEYKNRSYSKWQNSKDDRKFTLLKWDANYFSQSAIKLFHTDVYNKFQAYNQAEKELDMMYEELGNNPLDCYAYDDADKAQWFTNLWYRLNGESSTKSFQGMYAKNYQVIDDKIMNSKNWLKDALTQGVVTIEQANFCSKVVKDFPSRENPNCYTIKGVSWTTKTYSNCVDIIQTEDNIAIAKAESDYKKTQEEIAKKDQRYQNRMKDLDSEHNTLKTEYESLQKIVSKNIERTFKTFS